MPAARPTRCRGQTAVEAAVVLMTFVAVFLGIIDMGRIYMTWQKLQAGVREATRYGITGRAMKNKDREASIRSTLQSNSGLTIDPSNITIQSRTTTTAGSVTGAGTPNDVLIVSASMPVRIFSPWLLPVLGKNFTVRARAALRNENF